MRTLIQCAECLAHGTFSSSPDNLGYIHVHVHVQLVCIVGLDESLTLKCNLSCQSNHSYREE